MGRREERECVGVGVCGGGKWGSEREEDFIYYLFNPIEARIVKSRLLNDQPNVAG